MAADIFQVAGKLSQRLHWATREINHLVLHDGKYRLIRFLLANAKRSNDVDLRLKGIFFCLKTSQPQQSYALDG
jgi:hypothetical protein